MILKTTLVLLSRQMFVQGLAMICGVLLSTRLPSAEFGKYVLVTFLSSLLFFFSDLGLAAFLLKQKREPQPQELATVFTLRQILDVLVGCIFLLILPSLANWYSLNKSETNALLLLLGVLPLQSFGLISLLRSERDLQFSKISLLEVLQALSGSLLATSLAISGVGILSFVLGWLLYHLVGLFGLQTMSPWKPRLKFDCSFCRSALPFSIPYHFSGSLYLARDGALPILVAFFLGSAAVGLLNWAQMVALSIGFGSFVIQRGLYPIFSKFQPNSEMLLEEQAPTLETSLLCVVTFICVGELYLLAFLNPLTRLIFNSRWEEAHSLVYVLAAANLPIPFFIVFGALLNSLGKSQIVFRTQLLSAMMLWVGATLLVPIAGAKGYAVALVLSQFPFYFLYSVARSVVQVSLLRAYLLPIGISLSGCLLAMNLIHPDGIASRADLVIYSSLYMVFQGSIILPTVFFLRSVVLR